MGVGLGRGFGYHGACGHFEGMINLLFILILVIDDFPHFPKFIRNCAVGKKKKEKNYTICKSKGQMRN